MSKRTTLGMAQQMLEEARADVTHADQKASVLLAALGIGFGAVLGGQLSSNWDSSRLTTFGQVLWWLGVVAAVLSVAAAALAVWPRYKLDDRPTYGITYWGHAASFDDPKQLRAALDAQEVSSTARTSHQLWSLSRVVLRKYRYVRAALILAAVSGALLGFAAVIIR